MTTTSWHEQALVMSWAYLYACMWCDCIYYSYVLHIPCLRTRRACSVQLPRVTGTSINSIPAINVIVIAPGFTHLHSRGW